MGVLSWQRSTLALGCFLNTPATDLASGRETMAHPIAVHLRAALQFYKSHDCTDHAVFQLPMPAFSASASKVGRAAEVSTRAWHGGPSPHLATF